MKEMISAGVCPELSHTTIPDNDCESCQIAKMAAKPFAPKPEHAKATRPREIFHADLMGPIKDGTFSDAFYVLNIVDDFSNHAFVRLLHSKDEAAAEIIAWEKRMFSRHKEHPAAFYTDRGGEFMAGDLIDHWTAVGTTVQLTLPYTPQQNGKGERMNRTLQNIAASWMVDAGSPHKLWGEAICHAAYVHNLTCMHNGKQPNQLYYGLDKPQSIKHLRVWGCTAAVSIPPPKRAGKFEPRAELAIFVGCDWNGTWRFIRANDDEPGHVHVILSRTAHFFESRFDQMKTLMRSLIESGEEEEHSNVEYFSRVAEEGELRLYRVMHEAEEKAKQTAQRPAAAPRSPSPSGSIEDEEKSESPEPQLTRGRRVKGAAPTRRSPRVPAPAEHKLGMVGPRDLGLGLGCESIDSVADQIVKLEDDAADIIFGAAAAPRRRPETAAERTARELNRIQVRENASINFPLQPDRPDCNAKGSIEVPSRRCVANTRKGEQCGARTKFGALCWNHLRSQIGVRIQPSHIPGAGLGLIAARDLPKNTPIGPYCGDESRDPDETHGGSKYVFALSRARTIDAARTDTNPTRMINDSKGYGARNVNFIVDRIRGTVRVATSKAVKKGDELIIDYGDKYWKRVEDIEREKRQAARKHRAVADSVAIAAAAGKVHYLAQSSSPAAAEFFDPTTFEEAETSPDREKWRAAMRAEQNSLQEMKAIRPATLAERQSHPQTIGSKWVFKTKRDANNVVTRFKCRLVAQGYTQRAGRDYDETYAPVISYPSVRVLLAIAVQFDLDIGIYDVETAFLHAPLDRVQFIRAPKGFDGVPEGTLLVCERALYGLHQSGRLWNQMFVKHLEQAGFKSCSQDSCVFVHRTSQGRAVYAGIFVDDMIMMHDRRDQSFVDSIKQKLAASIKIKELPSSNRLLGMVIERDRAASQLHLHQGPYVKRIVQQFGFTGCKTELTPESTAKSAIESQAESSVSSPPAAPSGDSVPTALTMETLRAAIGSLSYAATSVHPELAHSVNMAAREQSAPTTLTLQRVNRMFRYLAGEPARGLLFTRNPSSIGLGFHAFSDADWGGSSSDGKSTSGDLGVMAGAAVYWSCKKQTTVAQSSTEAEYIAANESARNVTAMRQFLSELLIPSPVPTVLLIDNQTAIRMALDDNRAPRRKHINVKHHYIRDKMSEAEIKLEWIHTSNQLADLLTKPLPRATFAILRDKVMGFVENEDAVKHLASLSRSARSSSSSPSSSYSVAAASFLS